MLGRSLNLTWKNGVEKTGKSQKLESVKIKKSLISEYNLRNSSHYILWIGQQGFKYSECIIGKGEKKKKLLKVGVLVMRLNCIYLRVCRSEPLGIVEHPFIATKLETGLTTPLT